MKRRKGKGKFKRTGRASLAKNNHKILNCGQKRTLLGGPKERRARKAGQKATKAFTKVAFALTSQVKLQARTTPRTKTKDQKGKGKEGIYPQSGLSASETLNEKGYGHVWESDDWSASHWPDDTLRVVLYTGSYCMDGDNFSFEL